MTTREQVLETFERLGGNVSATARELGTARGTVQYHLKKAGANKKPLAGGQIEATKIPAKPLPRGGVKRYILTSAQNNTHVHAPTWENLEALAVYHDAEMLCASYTYNQNAYGELAVKPGTAKHYGSLWFDERVRGLLEKSDTNLELAPGLVWCGRMNTLPTAKRPLSGFETYTGRKSGIFPHSKMSMESVASAKHDATKFNYTTGTATQINYIQKTAGLRAEHHHTYGGLIVEVDSDGRWWVRQLSADSNGTIHDLDLKVENGVVSKTDSVEAINWGDIHAIALDPMVRQLAWAKGGMLDTLRPRHQFMHDLLDFRARNHHERRNAHKVFERWVRGQDSVEREIEITSEFLNESWRDWCNTVVVDSNHDNALLRWLRETDWRDDPQNSEFYLEAQLAVLRWIRGQTDFHLLEWAMQRAGANPNVQFLREDESFVICKDEGGGIECGMHGHLGPNGSRGSPSSLSRMGRKANTGHTHSAGILDGLYTAGTSSKLDMGYNAGPSSWSHSNIVTYPNGKRAIVTMWNWKWRA